METSSSFDDGLDQHNNDGVVGGLDRMRALADILHDHRPRIFRFLLASFADPEVARTLTERCLETACCEWRPSWDKSHIGSRLMRIAVDLERRRWQREKLCIWRKTDLKTAGLALLTDLQQDNQRPSEYQIQATEQIARMWNAVSAMKNEQRVVFLLHCVEEMELREIAGVTGLHERTVGVLLSEALDNVRAVLDAQSPNITSIAKLLTHSRK
jgi:RNA polymerase sigma-70 factor (ECF subfamily)